MLMESLQIPYSKLTRLLVWVVWTLSHFGVGDAGVNDGELLIVLEMFVLF